MLGRDERLAILETAVSEHTATFVAMRESLTHLEQRLDARMDRLEDKFSRLDDKVSRQFVWMVGIQITVLLTLVGSIVSVVTLLAPR